MVDDGHAQTDHAIALNSEEVSSKPWHKSYLRLHKYDFCGQHIKWDAKEFRYTRYM